MIRHYVAKKCIRCGRDFIPNCNRQKRCTECAVIAEKEYDAQWGREHRNQWNRANPERHAFLNRQWEQQHPEQSRLMKAKSNAKWRVANVEKTAAASKAWALTHVEQKKETNRRWQLANPEKVKEKSNEWKRRNSEHCSAETKRWIEEHPEQIQVLYRRHSAKRRVLGFIPMNQPFDGCEGHHLNQSDVIYIPKRLHRSVYHNVFTGKNMEKINALACAWYTEDWT